MRDVTPASAGLSAAGAGDAIGIQQVLVNMLSNALDASPAAAEIVIDFTESADEISFISDNGCGWPMALADH